MVRRTEPSASRNRRLLHQRQNTLTASCLRWPTRLKRLTAAQRQARPAEAWRSVGGQARDVAVTLREALEKVGREQRTLGGDRLKKLVAAGHDVRRVRGVCGSLWQVQETLQWFGRSWRH